MLGLPEENGGDLEEFRQKQPGGHPGGGEGKERVAAPKRLVDVGMEKN
jgi:hypothetical protein